MTRLKTGALDYTQTTLKQRDRECVWEFGVDGVVRSTKYREVRALEVRAGTPAVGRTSQDAAGFLAAPKETELKWPGELSGEWTTISLF